MWVSKREGRWTKQQPTRMPHGECKDGDNEAGPTVGTLPRHHTQNDFTRSNLNTENAESVGRASESANVSASGGDHESASESDGDRAHRDSGCGCNHGGRPCHGEHRGSHPRAAA